MEEKGDTMEEKTERLLKIYVAKKEIYKALGMRNVKVDFDERIKESVEYEIARREVETAYKNYINSLKS